MDIQVARIDENGFCIEPVVVQNIEDLPDNLIPVGVPTGLYKPKWDGVAWVEGLAQEAIDAILNTPQEPSTAEMLMLAIAELDAQRESDKLETQLAIAELVNTIMGGTV